MNKFFLDISSQKMLDPYADDLFRVIFNSPDITSELDQRSDTNIPLVQLQNGIKSIPVPLCIKFLFDFLDEEYLNNGISDPAIIHSWKSNWFANYIVKTLLISISRHSPSYFNYISCTSSISST